VKHFVHFGVGIAAITMASAFTPHPASAADTAERPWVEHGTYRLGPAPDFAFVDGSLSAYDAHLGNVDDDGTTVTAANGDQLRYQWVGDIDAAEVADFPACRRGFTPGWESDYVFTGGTGRFSGASGSTRSWNCYKVFADGGLSVEYISRGTLTY